MPEPRLIDDSLFTDRSGSALLGSSCQDCATTTFPAQGSCPRCSGESMSPRALPTRGTLWSFTIQSFAPKPPYCGRGEFEPFGVGYVDLGPVIVESRLTVADPAQLSIGAPMSLTTIPAFDDEDGTVVLTFAFSPDPDSAAVPA